MKPLANLIRYYIATFAAGDVTCYRDRLITASSGEDQDSWTYGRCLVIVPWLRWRITTLRRVTSIATRCQKPIRSCRLALGIPWARLTSVEDIVVRRYRNRLDSTFRRMPDSMPRGRWSRRLLQGKKKVSGGPRNVESEFKGLRGSRVRPQPGSV